MKSFAVLTFVALAFGCATAPQVQPSLATAHVVQDFSSYSLRRVGLVPFGGVALEPEHAEALQAALNNALSEAVSFEIVMLGDFDLEEIPRAEPSRKGWVKPDTVLAIARRYNLDGIFVGTVTQLQSYTPQKLGLSVDLVAAETGLSVWTASVELDASQARVQEAIHAWYAQSRASQPGSEGEEIYLLSPRRFAEFACAEIARML